MKEITQFLEYLKFAKNYSNNTLDAYSTDLIQFFDYTKKPYKNITRADIKKFLIHIRNKGFSTSTANRKLASIKSFFRFLLIEDKIKVNPAELIESAKIDRKLPAIVTDKDFELIMSNIDNLRDRTLIELLFATGIRREEAASLKKSYIYLNEGIIKVLGKNKKERYIPIYPQALPNLVRWLNQHSSIWLFPSKTRTGKHISTRQINEIVDKWVKKAGLEHKNITPHSFRHAFGTYLYSNGADIKAIQEMLGHASINTTNLYAHTSTKRNKKEYFKAHPMCKNRINIK